MHDAGGCDMGWIQDVCPGPGVVLDAGPRPQVPAPTSTAPARAAGTSS
jgi:hypothetical protein